MAAVSSSGGAKRTTKKKKQGRPLVTPEPREHSVTIRLNSTELRCLESYVWRYDTSMSDVLRDSLMLLSIIPQPPL